MEIISKFFNAKHTLTCGQVFRFKETNGKYTLISGNKKCLLFTKENVTTIETDEPEYFNNYFDLSTDYAAIANALRGFGIDYGYGIHILRQELFETIISFVISANNNIGRIQGIIESLCQKYGKKMDGYYAFPLPHQLRDASINDFRSLGLGYRDQYLFATVRAALETDILSVLKTQAYEDAVKSLCSLKGVGRKVADCIALFALSHTCCYPVDTWILKADGKAGDTAETVRKRAMQKYGEYAGYVQQHRFYYTRSNT